MGSITLSHGRTRWLSDPNPERARGAAHATDASQQTEATPPGTREASTLGPPKSAASRAAGPAAAQRISFSSLLAPYTSCSPSRITRTSTETARLTRGSNPKSPPNE